MPFHDRSGAAAKTTNPQAIRARILVAIRDVEGCLHPDAPGGCDRIIDAHSLQKRGPLFHLKDETNHVYTFSPGSNNAFPSDPDLVGWNEASTFRGLCHRHDQIFQSIENAPFSGSKEQVFLLGYRATYLEIHQKRAAIASCDKLGYTQMAGMFAEELPAVKARQMVRVQQAGRRRGLVELQTFKGIYDRAWRNVSTRMRQLVVQFIVDSLRLSEAELLVG